MKKRKLYKNLCSISLSALLFGGIGYSLNSHTTNAVSTTLTTLNSNESLDVTSIASQGLTSVVSITNVSTNSMNPFSRTIPSQQSTSVGSGVILYEDESSLYIVTNYHVIENATNLTVTFVDDNSTEATICGYDENKDIALIKVNTNRISNSTKSSITIASIGDSNELVIGQQVVAIGNALGYGQSVTTGIVSATNRSVESTSNTYIQTDAAINPGNSGGALFNMNGELIGINTAKISTTDVEGMGYAIPISDVLDEIVDMMEGV